MPAVKKKPKSQDLIERASNLQSLIAQLEKEIQQIFDSGQVAPENSWMGATRFCEVGSKSSDRQ
ncbi:hypothetical protein [Nodularia spumigena]